MRWRHARGQIVAAFVAILINAFAPTLHAIIHVNAFAPALHAVIRADSLAPRSFAELAANGRDGKSQDAPGKPSNEAQCPLGQALPSVGPALAPSGTAIVFLAALVATVEAWPAQSLDGIVSPRPSSRGPPALEA